VDRTYASRSTAVASSRGAAILLVGVSAALAFPLIGPSSPRSELACEGVVLDVDGSPLGGVCVRVKATDLATTTDATGRFSLHGGGDRVTAWKPGYLIAGAPAVSPVVLRLKTLPSEDNRDYHWVDPAPGGQRNCGTCHEEIYREWAGSAHAHSATGRHFRDLYEGTDAAGRPSAVWGLKTEFPDGAGVCSACHAPAIADHDPGRMDLARVQGVAASGVHCDYCHKVCGTGSNPPGLTHGAFDQRLLRPADGQLFFGSLDDVDRGEDAYSPVYRDSRYCASCHEGTVFGVHVYSTYSEWLVSPARRDGKQCQHCHMSPTGRMTNMAPGHGGVNRDPATLASHALYPGDQAEMLRRSVQVACTLVRSTGNVQARVRVRATDVGHRVPTGFIDRHLLLVVDAYDAGGQSLQAVDGPTLPAPAGQELVGHGGRLYGRLRSDFEGHSPAPFWRAAPDPVDTRLAPDSTDESLYTFSDKLDHVRVRLLYRRFWEETRIAKGWADMDIVVADVQAK
jgi:hypothetical protein